MAQRWWSWTPRPNKKRMPWPPSWQRQGSATRSGPQPTHDSAEELIRTAETTDADFIVIGLRRRSPVGKLLLGSNAQRVLLDAACPVLAVKAEPGNV